MFGFMFNNTIELHMKYFIYNIYYCTLYILYVPYKTVN